MAEPIRFYTDVHVPRSMTLALRRRGVDVLTAQELGLETASDEEHLARATAEGRVLLTQDADFLALHAAGTAHTGVVYARMGMPIGRIVQGSLLIFDVLTPEEMINHVEYL